MVEQEALIGFRRIVGQSPRAPSFANSIPGPNGIRIDAVHKTHLAFYLALMRFQPNPVVIDDADLRPQ